MPTPCYQQVIYGPDVLNGAAINPLLWADNNAVIPLTGKHRITTNLVYGDDEIQPLYQESTLDLEAIIYIETMTGSGDNVEAEVQRLRRILSTPSYQLKLDSVGLGQIPVINVTQADMKGGPFPQSVTVEPIASNNAILIRWSVMFRTINCIASTGSLLQYNVEQDMDVDDDGNMNFTLHITYQSRDPITDPNSLVALSQILIRRVDRSFQGMTKTKRTSMSRDQRILSIKLTYKEIESDSAFFPYTSNIEVTDELESELLGSSVYAGKGFYTWRRTLSGTIRLPPRIHKSWAWIVFIKILRSRFKKLYPFSKLAAVLGTTKDPAQVNDAEKQYYLPLRMKFTNPIYAREMRFDITYMVTSSMNKLFGNTKFFARVNTSFNGAEEESEPKTLSEQWKEWQDLRNTDLNGKFLYTVDGTPIVYNQCLGTYTTHEIGGNATLKLENDIDWNGESTPDPDPETERLDEDSQADAAPYPEAVYGDELLAANSWLTYDNDFEVIEDTNSIPVSFLEEPGTDYYNSPVSASTVPDRTKVGMSLHGKSSSASQTYAPTVIERGHSMNIVRMKGYAMRLGFKIPIPYVITIDGKVAKRIGQPRVSQKQVSQGDVPIYLAKWDIQYAVVGADIYSTDVLASIVTTGDPAMYT